MSNQQRPIACDLAALTDQERARRAELAAQLRAAVKRVEERPDGYIVEVDGGSTIAARLEELIELESRCCPFLQFETLARGEGRSSVLTISGSPDAKSLLAAEFGLDNRQTLLYEVRGRHEGVEGEDNGNGAEPRSRAR